MPIYEFYCPDCHRIFSFRARSVDTDSSPDCPRCARPKLQRRVSSFAISKGRKEDAAAGLGEGELDEERLESAMASLAGEMEGMDENDPRQAAHMLRRLYEASGMRLGPGMEEAMRRLEAGDDPDQIEQELSDVLEDEAELEPQPKARLERLRRRMLPPSVDDALYDL
jgi:putative FmdB family regulatory protein